LKNKFFKVIILFIILLTGCFLIFSEEKITDNSQEMALKFKGDIFTDYLWATPPLVSTELKFTQKNNDFKEAAFNFSGKDLKFILNNNDEISLQNDNTDNFIKPEKSSNNIYYSINELGTKKVPVERLVNKVRYEEKMVRVSRQYAVQKTRQVTSMGPNGQTSFHTEFYTDWETRWENELQSVPVYYTQMETVIEYKIDVPVYQYYKIEVQKDRFVYIYKIEKKGETKFYFQNPGYYTGNLDKEGIFSATNVPLVFIDINSNGNYFDEQDALFLNAWNPYDKNSTYKEITGYMDNYWYNIEELSKEKFINFQTQNDNKKVKIFNKNQEYFNTKKNGEFIISNLTKGKNEVHVNGEGYMINSKGIVKQKLKYGTYRLKIDYEWHVPYETTFTINEDSPKFIFDYSLTPEAGKFVFTDNSLKKWSLIFVNKKKERTVFYNARDFYLKPGVYNFTASSGGIQLTKFIEIKPKDTFEYNYKLELEKKLKE